jgi:hypothetical protein
MPVPRLLVAAAPVLLLVSACGGGGSSAPPEPQIAGVVHERAAGRTHRQGQIDYQGKLPPSGGDHNPIPLTCGFYDQQPPDEYAVHSLEHGAVWIAFDPSISAADKATLKALAGPKVLVTPYSGMDTKITLVAWERRLELPNVSDPRLKQFVDGYRDGATAPERGGRCAGVGQPAS